MFPLKWEPQTGHHCAFCGKQNSGPYRAKVDDVLLFVSRERNAGENALFKEHNLLYMSAI